MACIWRGLGSCWHGHREIGADADLIQRAREVIGPARRRARPGGGRGQPPVALRPEAVQLLLCATSTRLRVPAATSYR